MKRFRYISLTAIIWTAVLSSMLIEPIEGNAQLKFSGVKLSGLKKIGGFDPAYQAILDYATNQGYNLPSLSNQIAQNALLVQMKIDGNWGKLEWLYVYANDAGTSDFATINWRSPGTFPLTKTNSPGWTSKGFSTNGTTSRLQIAYNPSTQAVLINNLTLLLGIYFHTGGDTGGTERYVASQNDGTSYIEMLDQSSNVIATRITGNGTSANMSWNSPTSTNSFASGHTYSSARGIGGTGVVSNYDNGVSVSQNTKGAQAFPNSSTFYILCRSGASSFGLSTWVVSNSWLGTNSINQLKMHNAFSAYMTAVP